MAKDETQVEESELILPDADDFNDICSKLHDIDEGIATMEQQLTMKKAARKQAEKDWLKLYKSSSKALGIAYKEWKKSYDEGVNEEEAEKIAHAAECIATLISRNGSAVDED